LRNSIASPDLPLCINLIHNPHLESFHYTIRAAVTIRAAADLVCKLPSTKITTIGIDVSPDFLSKFEGYHLQRLGRSVTSRFPRLSKILIRLEFANDTFLDAIYDAFASGQALGILEVEVLPSEKRFAVQEFTDDCLSKGMSG
jgi:hypothetical protein